MTPLIAMPAPAQLESGSGKWPEFPALSALLRGARRLPVAPDWRSGVLAVLGSPEVAVLPVAAVAARAIPRLVPGAAVCLVLPVHAIAGISRMYLAAGDSFAADAAERESLRRAFNAEFGAPDLHLHSAGSGWLLQAPFAAAANDESPELLVGAALAREPAVSADLRMLRRLGAEVEMWLASLPSNLAREKRGIPPVNGFWFWGGSVANPVPVSAQGHGGIFSNVEPDAWVSGLAAWCEKPVQHACCWDDVRATPGAVVILQPVPLGDVMQQMSAWEAQWLEPLQRDVAARCLSGVRLQIGRSAWQLPGSRLSSWLRRSQPWWQAVKA